MEKKYSKQDFLRYAFYIQKNIDLRSEYTAKRIGVERAAGRNAYSDAQFAEDQTLESQIREIDKKVTHIIQVFQNEIPNNPNVLDDLQERSEELEDKEEQKTIQNGISYLKGVLSKQIKKQRFLNQINDIVDEDDPHIQGPKGKNDKKGKPNIDIWMDDI